jgi:hypothetical protein
MIIIKRTSLFILLLLAFAIANAQDNQPENNKKRRLEFWRTAYHNV